MGFACSAGPNQPTLLASQDGWTRGAIDRRGNWTDAPRSLWPTVAERGLRKGSDAETHCLTKYGQGGGGGKSETPEQPSNLGPILNACFKCLASHKERVK